jgi:hypothetical protein
VLADSSVAVLALPAIYRELEVDLGDLHWVLTTSNLVLALVRLRPRGSRAQHWRNHWRATRRLALKVRRLQQFSQRCTPLPKPRALVRFRPGAPQIGRSNRSLIARVAFSCPSIYERSTGYVASIWAVRARSRNASLMCRGVVPLYSDSMRSLSEPPHSTYAQTAQYAASVGSSSSSGTSVR